MNELTIFTKNGELTGNITDELISMELELIFIENRRATIMKAIQEAMEKNEVKKFENDRIVITYVEPTSRLSLDQKSLKENDLDVYLKYVKESPVKASVRLKCK